MKANYKVQLQVNVISGNSGVYFGNTNVIFGLSNHSKSNTGFGGVGSQNKMYQNLGIVYDPDWIDTPIDDRDVHVYAPHHDHSAESVMNAKVDSINVQTVTQNSGIFVGDADITGLDSHEKNNTGFGFLYGNQNLEAGNVNITYDSDVIDMPIDDRDNKSAVFIAPSSPMRVNGG